MLIVMMKTMIGNYGDDDDDNNGSVHDNRRNDNKMTMASQLLLFIKQNPYQD